MVRQTFRQSDLQKALRGARAEGFDPEEVRITSSGDIRLLTRRQASLQASPEVDAELDAWEAKHATP